MGLRLSYQSYQHLDQERVKGFSISLLDHLDFYSPHLIDLDKLRYWECFFHEIYGEKLFNRNLWRHVPRAGKFWEKHLISLSKKVERTHIYFDRG